MAASGTSKGARAEPGGRGEPVPGVVVGVPRHQGEVLPMRRAFSRPVRNHSRGYRVLSVGLSGSVRVLVTTVEDDAVELFEEGAKVLTQEMVKGGWTVVQAWVTRLFKGDATKRQEALGELERSRADLEDDPTLLDDVQQEWKTRLRRLLREDPRAATELRALLDEVAPQRGGDTIINTARDISGGGFVIQAREVRGGVHKYDGDHIDVHGSQAQGDIIGTRYNDGTRRREG